MNEQPGYHSDDIHPQGLQLSYRVLHPDNLSREQEQDPDWRVPGTVPVQGRSKYMCKCNACKGGQGMHVNLHKMYNMAKITPTLHY